MRSNVQEIRPSDEEIRAFIEKIDEWVENEKRLNPNNHENIITARNLILNSYQESRENLLLNQLNLTSLPAEIGELINLKYLELSNNKLSSLPPEIGNLVELHAFYLDENNLTTLPPEIGNLVELHAFYLDENNLTTLPPEIGNLVKLSTFSLIGNALESIPPEIGNLTNLAVFDLTSNQLTSLPEEINFLLDQDFVVLEDNPNLVINNEDQEDALRTPKELIDFLCESANFSEEQRSQNYRVFLDLQDSTKIDEALIIKNCELDDPSQSSQDEIDDQVRSGEDSSSEVLSARLGAILEFLCKAPNEDSSDDEYDLTMPNLLKAIIYFVNNSGSWQSDNSDQKEYLARYLLTILSQIYERRDDKTFLDQIEIIAQDSLETCEDRNSLLIFTLANFCQRKNSDYLNLMAETQPSQLFDYFKNQLLYNHFLDLGQEKVNQIKIENLGFAEDVEVLLNYLRIYNNKFGKSLNLNLPNIGDQFFYDEVEYQPSEEQIEEFKSIVDKFKHSDLSALQDKLTDIFVKDFDKKLPYNNSEILEISFVKNHIKQIENIAQEFLSLFEDHKQQRGENDQEMTDGEYNQKMKEINEFKSKLTKKN
jgi:Leucine-rich repeat (LRR) protein